MKSKEQSENQTPKRVSAVSGCAQQVVYDTWMDTDIFKEVINRDTWPKGIDTLELKKFLNHLINNNYHIDSIVKTREGEMVMWSHYVIVAHFR